MELRDYLRILRKSWILIVACLLLGVGAAAAYTITITPKYQAMTKLYVSVRASDAAITNDLVQGTNFARQAVSSYVDVVSSASVLDKVIADLKLPTTAATLAKSVTATNPLNTVLIEITVTDDNPKTAATIANSIGKNFQSVVVDNLEKPTGGGESLVKIETIQPALAPAKPSSPNVPLNIALRLLVGLAIEIGAAVMRSLLDTRVRTSADIEQIAVAPILGGTSFDPEIAKRRLVVQFDPRNPRAEAFRSLRTNLQFLTIEGSPRCFVITSSVPGEGKSTTTCNLAIALAETGARVALIDGDLRLPKVADYMGIEGGVGLAETLIGRVELADVLQKWGRGQLYVLPSGRVPLNPSELLGSKAMSTLLARLNEKFDYVLIDSPPLLLVTDAAILSTFATGAILITASGSTKRNELAAATRALANVGGRLLGVVVSMLPTKGPDAYAYGAYGYGVVHGEIEEEDDHAARSSLRPVEHRSRRSAG
ncbi:MAG: polysaccharide biosynthesis tyrosine autokinase [Microbacteriaceae bacterium]